MGCIYKENLLVLNNTHEYLKYLLGQEKWTSEEMEWMLKYLDKEDLSELEAAAGGSFNADVAFLERGADAQYAARVLERLHERINVPHPRQAKRVWLYKATLAAAAVVGIIAGAGYFLRKGSPHGMTDGHVKEYAGPVPGAATGGGHMSRAVTSIKERKTVQMPDGTQVSLEQGSTLEYPDRFSDNNREVYLNGEAFFEVKKDEKRPFIVHTRFLQTTVLGTSFNVDAYAPGETRVVVVTGMVKVAVEGQGKAGQDVVITPNQRAVYYAAPDRLEKQEATEDAVFYQQRRNGSFVYTDVPVAKVLKDMQRFYHIKVVLQGDMQNCIFHGHFHVRDDLDKALNLIVIPLNANIRKDTTAGTYTIYGGGCQ
jgi:transmembrane sensor